MQLRFLWQITSVIIGSLLLLPLAQIPNDKSFRYVEATGHSIINPILRLYNRTGGEIRHGKPLSEPIKTKDHYAQYFERSVLEFYPQYAGTAQEVKLAPLGRWAAESEKVNLEPLPAFVGKADKWYFSQTGHSLSDAFLIFWRNDDTIGLPISEPLETQEDNILIVQYFENARLQQSADGKVSLSNLGTNLAKKQLKDNQLAPVPVARFNVNTPRSVRIPSLMFHYARLVDPQKDQLGYDLSIKPDNYVKFLDWVQANGYNTITVSQVLDYLKYGILLPDKPVLFRWDDGHADNWFVYEEMKKRGMTATFYVISQQLELTPSQWKQIDQDGFEVAPHTRNHRDLRTVNSTADIASEITGSKQDIERIVGHPVRSFAYPYGGYNDKAVQVVRDSGFEIAVSTNGGYNWNLSTMLEQPVVSVTGEDNLDSFARKITNANR